MMQHARSFPALPAFSAAQVPRGAEWLAQVFHCRAATTGGVIRCQIVDVERAVGSAAFVAGAQPT